MEENNNTNKNNNKIGIIIIILLIILIIIGIYLIKNKNDNKENNANGNVNNNQEESNIKNGDDRYLGSSLNKQEGTVISENTAYIIKRINKDLAFYYNDKEVSRYNCESETCSICSVNSNNSSNDDGRGCPFSSNIDAYDKNATYLIVDGYNSNNTIKKLVIINPENNLIYNEYYNVDSVIGLNNEYIYFSNKTENKNIIIDTKGNTIKNLANRELAIKVFSPLAGDIRLDYMSYDLIVTVENGKYGIESLLSDKKIIENKYEDVRLFDMTMLENSPSFNIYNGKYFKAKENGKWYLFNISTGEKVLNKGYDRLYLLDSQTMLIYENNYLSFVDYDGKELIPDKIETSSLKNYDNNFLPKMIEGIQITKENDNINIYVSDLGKTYTYNLNTKTLTNN